MSVFGFVCFVSVCSSWLLFLPVAVFYFSAMRVVIVHNQPHIIIVTLLLYGLPGNGEDLPLAINTLGLSRVGSRFFSFFLSWEQKKKKKKNGTLPLVDSFFFSFFPVISELLLNAVRMRRRLPPPIIRRLRETAVFVGCRKKKKTSRFS